MEVIAKTVCGADKILNLFLSVIIVLALLFGCFSLWDTYSIFQGAAIDNDLLKYKPIDNSGDASGSTLSELIAINEDVKAWITVDNTGIDYPVVQGTTNMEYINTDVYGNYALSGSIFIDCRNVPSFSDFYTLLYGHHMESGAMFGNVLKYHDKAYFDEHTTGMLYTLQKTYRLEIYACLSVDAYNARVFDPVSGGADMLEYIKKNALQYREINMSAEDHIIGLSTCSDTVTNGRTIVFARLTEITDQGGGKTQ